jgi:hypothetical protein
VLYLDPPYPGTAGYGEEYAALDRLLGDNRPPQAAPVLADLLAASTHIKTLVLSYGGPRTDLDALVAAVAGQRTIQRALAIPYRHLGALATEQKNASNKEFLVLATR